MSREVPRIGPAAGDGPLMLAWNVRGARVLVVGGGAVGAERVRLLLFAGADVHVVARRASAELCARERNRELALSVRRFADADLDRCAMVFVAIDDPAESRRIAGLARAAGIPVNVADVPALCDFYVPAIHRDGPVQIAVSTGGKGPALAARIRDLLARTLPAEAARAVERFGDLRRAVRAADPAPERRFARMPWLRRLAQSASLEQLAALDPAAIRRQVARYLREHPRAPGIPAQEPVDVALAPAPHRHAPRPGRVALVGAGPGDPDLLTLAARRRIERADLVVCDALVPAAIRALARGEIRVAHKRGGRADSGQHQLIQWMREAALAGRDVVRLKAGDPGLFGRALEEMDALDHAGIEVDIVPGITSALAAAAALGIPTTARGVADRLLVCTGHGQAGGFPAVPDFDPGCTYLFLMAVRRLESLVRDLLEHGFPPDLPAAIVERASHPDERCVRTTLGDLTRVARGRVTRSPAVLMLGHIVTHARAEPAALAAEARIPA